MKSDEKLKMLAGFTGVLGMSADERDEVAGWITMFDEENDFGKQSLYQLVEANAAWAEIIRQVAAVKLNPEK